MLTALTLLALTTVSPPTAPSDLATLAPFGPDSEVTVVYLGCRIRETALAECQVVSPDPVAPMVAAMALKLTSTMSVSKALAERLDGHIVVKLSLKP